MDSGLEPEQEVLVPLPVAGLDRRLHAVGLLAGAVGVLGDVLSLATSFLRRDTALIPYEILILSPIEGINVDEQKAGIGYLDKMNEDIENLKIGLQCH